MAVDAKSLDYFGKVGRGKSRHRPRNDPALYGGPYATVRDQSPIDAHFSTFQIGSLIGDNW